MPPPYKVLLVDDSDLVRQALRGVLASTGLFTVIDEARTGEEAIAIATARRPDLITMDLQMPGIGGLAAIERIMAVAPAPLVVISERSPRQGEDLAYEALSRGALELIPKAALLGGAAETLRRFGDEMVRLIEARQAPRLAAPPRPAPAPRRSSGPVRVVALAASSGGPKLLATVLAALPRDFPAPVLVVQHMGPDFFEGLMRFLRSRSALPVVQASENLTLARGTVYLAAPGCHLTVNGLLQVKLEPAEGALHAPSADRLFESLAVAVGAQTAAVVLTGMGSDGARGLLALHRAGARTAAQDVGHAAVGGMPQAALALGGAGEVLSSGQLVGWLVAQAAPSEGDDPKAERRLPAKPRGRHILIVDDSAVSLEATRLALESAGYVVTTLENPLLVAATMRRQPFDLVLLDVNMPAVQGHQVLRALTGNGVSSTPVVLYSGIDLATLERRARECGAAGWLRKTSNEAELLESVARYL